jgi:hypothetical protein
MALDDFSRFKISDRIIVDGKETFGTWKQFSFLKTRPSDEFIGTYNVTSATEGRPDLIAFAVYGSAQLDWVLIAFNKVRETLNWPRAGDLIEYPLETIVLPELL